MAHLWLAPRRSHPQKPRIPRRGLSGEIRPRSESLAGHFECPRRLQPAFPTTSSGLASGTLRHTSVQRLATRKPMLLFSFVASLLLRFEDRRLFSLLFHGPPRSPRLVLACVPQVKAHPPEDAPSQPPTRRMARMRRPAPRALFQLAELHLPAPNRPRLGANAPREAPHIRIAQPYPPVGKHHEPAETRPASCATTTRSFVSVIVK